MKTGIRKVAGRTAAAALAGVLAAGSLTGCAEKKLDGTKTVATVNGADISMGLLSLYARQQQAYTEAMYASIYSSMGTASSYAIWDTVSDEESGKTYGEEVVEDCLEQIELMYLMKEKAPDYGVEITAEDQSAIGEASAAFMAANSEETIEALAVSEEDVKTLLELRTYSQRIHDPIIADVDREVSDEEAQQSSFTYVNINALGTDEEPLTEEDIETTKANAQAILDKMKEDPDADMDEVAKEVDDTLNAYEGTFTANVPEAEEGEEEEAESSVYPDEVLAVLRELSEGEVADEVIETDSSYYIVRLDEEFDEDATESRKESIISDREDEFYQDTTDQWLADADIQVQEKVLKTLKITDNHKFTMISPETEEDEDGHVHTEDEEAVVEDGAEDEDGAVSDTEGTSDDAEDTADEAAETADETEQDAEEDSADETVSESEQETGEDSTDGTADETQDTEDTEGGAEEDAAADASGDTEE